MNRRSFLKLSFAAILSFLIPVKKQESQRGISPFKESLSQYAAKTTDDIQGTIWGWYKVPSQANSESLVISEALKARGAGAKFAFIRAGSVDNVTGICYKDYQFDRNMILALEQMPIGCYWYFRPNHDALRQAEFMAFLLANTSWKLRPVIDVETNANLSPHMVMARVVLMITRLEEKLHCMPIIYTRATFWNYCVEASAYWRNLDLWAARYNTNIAGPWSDNFCKFRDWTDWRLWQFSADGNNRGVEFGSPPPPIACASMDLDYFNGDETAFRQWAGLEPPPPPVPTLEERVCALENEARQNGWDV